MRNSKLFLLGLMLLSLTTEARKSRNKFVEIETTKGMLKVEVFADVPQHAENFLKLADEGFYDSLLFHRVIPNFMIQGGDPDSKQAAAGSMLGNGGTGYKVPAEFKEQYFHRKGALAAARDNNPEKASSGCQFYIVQGKVLSDAELDMMQQRNGKTYTPEVRQLYKTEGGTPHLDGSYTVFGQLVEGFDVLEAITHVACNASDRPIEDVRILRMTVKKK